MGEPQLWAPEGHGDGNPHCCGRSLQCSATEGRRRVSSGLQLACGTYVPPAVSTVGPEALARIRAWRRPAQPTSQA